MQMTQPKNSIIVLTRGFSGSSMTSKLESLSDSSKETSLSSLSAMSNEVKYIFAYKSLLSIQIASNSKFCPVYSGHLSAMLYNFPSKFYSNFLGVKLSAFFSEICLNLASWRCLGLSCMYCSLSQLRTAGWEDA